MKAISVLAALLFVILECFAQEAEPRLPPEHLELRARLEADTSVVQMTCGLMLPILPGEVYTEKAPKQQAENTRHRLTFYKTALEKRSMRLAYSCETDEGGIVRKYLLSEKGKLTHVADFSRDPFGGRRMLINECSDLQLGHFVSTKDRGIIFERFDLKDSKGRVVWLTCRSADALHTF